MLVGTCRESFEPLRPESPGGGCAALDVLPAGSIGAGGASLGMLVPASVDAPGTVLDGLGLVSVGAVALREGTRVLPDIGAR